MRSNFARQADKSIYLYGFIDGMVRSVRNYLTDAGSDSGQAGVNILPRLV